jgi:hypothetical protein
MAHEFGSSPITISALLHALPAGVALLDHRGVILEVNQSWNVFSAANGRPDPQAAVGARYLDVCGTSPDGGSVHAERTRDSLQSILAGYSERFEWVHRADAGGAVRWFHVIDTIGSTAPRTRPEAGSAVDRRGDAGDERPRPRAHAS